MQFRFFLVQPDDASSKESIKRVGHVSSAGSRDN